MTDGPLIGARRVFNGSMCVSIGFFVHIIYYFLMTDRDRISEVSDILILIMNKGWS